MFHRAGGSRSLDLSIPSDVPMSERPDLETELSPPGAVGPDPADVPVPQGEIDVCANMTARKAASVEAAEVFIARHANIERTVRPRR